MRLPAFVRDLIGMERMPPSRGNLRLKCIATVELIDGSKEDKTFYGEKFIDDYEISAEDRFLSWVRFNDSGMFRIGKRWVPREQIKSIIWRIEDDDA